MDSVDKGHLKPKKPKPDSSRQEHVRPAPGRQARITRREITRESRRNRPAIAGENPIEATQPVVPMLPRAVPQRRRLPRRDEGRVTDRVRPRGLVWMSWRWVSGIMTATLATLLALLLSSDAFYISTVSVGGVNYLSREDIFRFSGVSQKHLFWVDAKQIEAQLESNNNIAAADVHVGWPSRMVQIVVREREPVLIWEQNSDRVWVDINGRVMFQREDRPELLRVVYDPNEVQPQATIGPESRIPQELVEGALLLKSRLPSIDVLLYHPIKGLGWRDPKGWMAWFGMGDNMAMKAHVYEALVEYNQDAVQFGEVDVSDPDNPVYTILWEKTAEQPQ
jgi:hypothetical protein